MSRWKVGDHLVDLHFYEKAGLVIVAVSALYYDVRWFNEERTFRLPSQVLERDRWQRKDIVNSPLYKALE
jgi:hypothetical protein